MVVEVIFMAADADENEGGGKSDRCNAAFTSVEGRVPLRCFP
jgi:hypothetical protein